MSRGNKLTITISAGAEQGKTSLALTIADLLKKAEIGKRITVDLEEAEISQPSKLERKLVKAQYALEDAEIVIQRVTI